MRPYGITLKNPERGEKQLVERAWCRVLDLAPIGNLKDYNIHFTVPGAGYGLWDAAQTSAAFLGLKTKNKSASLKQALELQNHNS